MAVITTTEEPTVSEQDVVPGSLEISDTPDEYGNQTKQYAFRIRGVTPQRTALLDNLRNEWCRFESYRYPNLFKLFSHISRKLFSFVYRKMGKRFGKSERKADFHARKPAIKKPGAMKRRVAPVGGGRLLS